MAPQQKPGRSKQDYQTPPEFIAAVKRRLGIDEFLCDLAANQSNAQSLKFLNKEINALTVPWGGIGDIGWNWLNPPYRHIAPWVEKTATEYKRNSAYVAVLVPASTGANWWRDWVHHKAVVVFLNGRLTFVGERDPYPKDCALLFYGPHTHGFHYQYNIWNWKRDAS